MVGFALRACFISHYQWKISMRPIFLFIALFLATTPADLAASAYIDNPSDTWLEIGPSYRQDKLKWNIAGPHHEPNIFSELKWNNLQIAQGTLDGKYTIPSGFYGRVNGSYGHIYEGHVTDADYAGNNRTYLFSFSKSKAHKGNVWDLSGRVGYPLLNCPHFRLTPVVGYSHHEQQLKIIGGKLWIHQQIVNRFFSDSSSVYKRSSSELSQFVAFKIPGVDSSYKTKWSGPWAGVDWECMLNEKFDLLGDLQYHWAHYRARGHWNQRADLADDFKHEASGFGAIANGGIRWNFSCRWALTLSGSYSYWRTRKGTDTTYFFADTDSSSSGSREILKGKLRLNHVKWQSASGSLLLSYYF